MLNASRNSPLPVMWWVKFGLIVLALIFGISFTLPTFLGDPKGWPRDKSEVVDEPGRPSNWYHRVAQATLPDSRISLGLDLKGGLHLVLEVDVEKSVKDTILRAVNRGRDNASKNGLVSETPQINDDYVVTIKVADVAKKEELSKEISDQSYLILFDKADGNTLKFKPNALRVEEFSKQLLQQAINTIRNRIDQFGVSEPSIFKQGERRIVVQMPGIQDSTRAKQLIGNTALLDFRMVLNEVPQEGLNPLLDEARKALNIPVDDTKPESIQKLSAWLRDNKKISAAATILLQRNYEVDGGVSKVKSTVPYLVEAQSRLTGDLIDGAEAVTTNQSLIPDYAVSMRFNPQGAKIFGDLTTAARDPKNVPHQIAIVLDDNINSAPVVNEPILNGSAQITLGSRNADMDVKMKEAQDLALVLRAGALPASVKIVEERQVGPSEGEENIRAGVISSGIAALLVVIIMLIIYGASGLVANFAMLFNVLLTLAFLSAFGATLTLPGIAGIVLTMAVAVDGNVIINERIREEIRNGLSVKQAFYKGYNHSFVTLIDAHVTSAVAGFVLLIYGNPATKGFAVTLLAGIVSTLFTSYYVTEVIGQWMLEKTRIKRFS